MCYCPPWAESPLQQLSDALFHRRSPYHYNVDGCRRDRFVKPFLLSWDWDGFPAPLELSSKRDTTSIRDITVSRTIIQTRDNTHRIICSTVKPCIYFQCYLLKLGFRRLPRNCQSLQEIIFLVFICLFRPIYMKFFESMWSEFFTAKRADLGV